MLESQGYIDAVARLEEVKFWWSASNLRILYSRLSRFVTASMRQWFSCLQSAQCACDVEVEPTMAGPHLPISASQESL